MKVKPVIPRARVNQDEEDTISYYLGEQVGRAALGFIDALARSGYRSLL